MTTKQEALDALKAIYKAHVGYRPEHPLYSPSIEAGLTNIIDFINSVPEWRPIEEYDFAKGDRVYV